MELPSNTGKFQKCLMHTNSPESIHLFLFCGSLLNTNFWQSATVSQSHPSTNPATPMLLKSFMGTLMGDAAWDTVTGSSTVHAHSVCILQKNIKPKGNLNKFAYSRQYESKKELVQLYTWNDSIWENNLRCALYQDLERFLRNLTPFKKNTR